MCKVMHIGKLTQKFDYSMHKNKNDIAIKKGPDEKDLSLTFDENLSFDAHVQRVKKMYQLSEQYLNCKYFYLKTC